MQEKQVNQTKTRNNSKAMLHFIAIVLTVVTIVSLAIGLFAWSKYTASINGNATAQVAKWNFNLSLKSGATSVTGNNSLNLADTLDQEATHVLDGKIAPGTSGTFDIEIDTRGTEVAMLYDVTIGMSNCPRNITFSKKGPGENSFTVISPMQTGDETTRLRTINFSKYLTLNDVTTAKTNDTKFVETIKWEWPYELTGNDPATNQPYTAEQKNAYDLRDNADQGQTVTINITAVGTEVMNAPLTTATVTYTKGAESSTLNNGDTLTIQMEDEATDKPTLSLSSGTEGVTYSSSQTSVATINESGELTLVGTGTTVITIKGKETDKEIKVNVKVKPKLAINVGDTIYYSPTGSYNWDKNLATSDFSGENSIEQMTTGDNGTHNITTWKVLNVDNDTGAIDMVPANPSAAVRLQGAQGYNNAVKLLNDACSSLYSDSNKGITARSINIEDIEAAIKAGGSARADALNTAKTNAGVGTKQDTNPYSTSNSKYPTIYEREESNVITPEVTVEDGKDVDLGQSEQTQFTTKTESSATSGYKQAGTSIQPYQTYYYLSWGSTAKENLLKKSYWVASRCVRLNGSNCNFNVRCAYSSDVRAYNMFNSNGDAGNYSLGLFPVVSLNSSVLSLKSGTTNQYNVD